MSRSGTCGPSGRPTSTGGRSTHRRRSSHGCATRRMTSPSSSRRRRTTGTERSSPTGASWPRPGTPSSSAVPRRSPRRLLAAARHAHPRGRGRGAARAARRRPRCWRAPAGRARLRRPRGTTRGDDGGVLRSRRAAVHPTGARVGAGRRPEWRRSARWHAEVSASSGFVQRERRYTHTVESSHELARFAAHHVPFYEQLHAQRLGVGVGANGRLLTEQPGGVPSACWRSGTEHRARAAVLERLRGDGSGGCGMGLVAVVGKPGAGAARWRSPAKRCHRVNSFGLPDRVLRNRPNAPGPSRASRSRARSRPSPASCRPSSGIRGLGRRWPRPGADRDAQARRHGS